jgi:hypothetical protein
MAWIELHQSLPRHPKLIRLANRLQIPRAQAAGHLTFLWLWTLDYSPTGDLSAFGSAELSAAADFDGDAESFDKALHQEGWIDENGKIHDWEQYAGRLLDLRERGKERMRTLRARSHNNGEHEANVCVSYRGPNQPNQPNQPGGGTPLPPKGTPPTDLAGGFPATEDAAVAHAATVGCSEEFAALEWNLAAGRGGRDSKDVPIRSWRNHLVARHAYAKASKPEAKAPDMDDPNAWLAST